MNKVHLSINYSQLMRRIFLVYRIALILLLLAALFLPHAFAVEDMWVAANRIIKDVYTKIAGVSTVLAGLMSAVAVIGAKCPARSRKQIRRGTGSSASGLPGSLSTASAHLSLMSARCSTVWLRWSD